MAETMKQLQKAAAAKAKPKSAAKSTDKAPPKADDGHELVKEGYIKLSEEGAKYLEQLVEQKEEPIGVRVFVTQPGTPNAETCLAYCPAGEEDGDDLRLGNLSFDFFIQRKSIAYLEDAIIDFKKDDFGGQLTIKAPNSKMMKVDENSPVRDQVNYILYTEINPALASHGGLVNLLDLAEEETIAVLQFGGGCQGCGMIDVTLKQGVEKVLLERVPKLKGIRDATDHSDRSQAYY